MRLLLRWLINALALLALNQFVAGFHVESFYAAVIAALVLVLTLPVTIVTLGLFTFVINAGLIWFMSSFVKGVEVAGFLPALVVAIILWAVSTLTSWMLKAE